MLDPLILRHDIQTTVDALKTRGYSLDVAAYEALENRRKALQIKMEELQREKADWWDTVSIDDKQAIDEGLKQLDQGDFLTRSQVRDKVKARHNL